MIGNCLFRYTWVVLLLLLGACASQPPAPVVDLTTGHVVPASASASQVKATTYTVRTGDTLYAISVLYNLDWRDLAHWNAIAAPYLLQPGRVVRLTPPSGLVASAATTTNPASEHGFSTPQLQVTTVTDTAKGTAAAPKPEPKALPALKSKPPVAPLQPAHTPIVAPPPPAPVAPATHSVGTQVAQAATRKVAGIAWRWPAQGKIIKSYQAGDPTRQGIDIAGQRGEPVIAAADGNVVYSGNGLVGYGELIIIKHNDTFLSAYGHNAKRLVHEGEHVQAGQKIAEMGSSGTSQVELHFEIRKQGKPVDPMAFMPNP
ncbi:MAG: peptidoglycan DD-metalloendopeptidase family protein [Xanthomonadales bacterium]|nr:peptidoglycan DD-metalloendopeptidase family protein [Xanthomonadales bacterium]